MNYHTDLDRLFEQWIAAGLNNNEWQSAGRIIFTRDGILEKNDLIDVESLWYNMRKRVLFLIKDQPSEWSDDIRLWLKDMKEDSIENLSRKSNNRELKSRFMRNIANVFWGLLNIVEPTDCVYSKVVQSFDDVKRVFNTIPFALVECKKQGGGASITNSTLKLYLRRYKEFICREIDILRPNIIVCTNNLIYDFVIDYYHNKYPDYPLMMLSEQGHNSLRFHPKTQALIFNSYHPSARISYEKFYMGIMNHYQAFLQSDYIKNFNCLYE